MLFMFPEKIMIPLVHYSEGAQAPREKVLRIVCAISCSNCFFQCIATWEHDVNKDVHGEIINLLPDYKRTASEV